MSILCLEGASSVGKTTICKYLKEKFGFKCIPEINELFERTSVEATDWYFEMQIKRWEIARDISHSGKIAVLDGDPFQPLWYNSIFSDRGFQPLDEVIHFYQKAMDNNRIRFPDKYYVLRTSEEELRKRKQNDRTRRRRNFELHLNLITPQLNYFQSINDSFPGTVNAIESENVENVAQHIISTCTNYLYIKNQIDIFNTACGLVWKQYNQALQRKSC